MAALMTSDFDNTDRLAIEITECKHMGIEVLAPDVNESFHEFAVVPSANQIRFGLDAIKNVGHGAVEEILRAREEKAGALDRFGDRGMLLANLENLMLFAVRTQKENLSGQVDLFSSQSDALEVLPQLALDRNLSNHAPHEYLAWERQLLGLYLSQTPLQDYELILSEQTTAIAGLKSEDEGKTAQIGGMIVGSREITTKTGAKMAFVKITDTSGEMEAVVFPKSYQSTTEIWQRDQVVIAKGRLSTRGAGNGNSEGELKLLVDDAGQFLREEAISYKAGGQSKLVIDTVGASSRAKVQPKVTGHERLYIRLEDSSNQPLLLSLKEKLDHHQGQTEVVLVTGPVSSKQIIKLPQSISIKNKAYGI